MYEFSRCNYQEIAKFQTNRQEITPCGQGYVGIPKSVDICYLSVTAYRFLTLNGMWKQEKALMRTPYRMFYNNDRAGQEAQGTSGPVRKHWKIAAPLSVSFLPEEFT